MQYTPEIVGVVAQIIADEEYVSWIKAGLQRNLCIRPPDSEGFQKKISKYLTYHPEIECKLCKRKHRVFVFRFVKAADMERVFLDVCMMGREK